MVVGPRIGQNRFLFAAYAAAPYNDMVEMANSQKQILMKQFVCQ